jgi:hypothetical protein
MKALDNSIHMPEATVRDVRIAVIYGNQNGLEISRLGYVINVTRS